MLNGKNNDASVIKIVGCISHFIPNVLFTGDYVGHLYIYIYIYMHVKYVYIYIYVLYIYKHNACYVIYTYMYTL